MSTDYTALDEGSRKVSSYESVQAEILHAMLQEGYDYAGGVPQRIHLYLQVTNGRAGADFLFELSGKILEVNRLDQSDFELEFELTPERQQMLRDNMGPHILKFISNCTSHNKPIPSEVWASADIAFGSVSTTTSLGYNYTRSVEGTQDALAKWKLNLEDPSFAAMRALTAIEPDNTTLELWRK